MTEGLRIYFMTSQRWKRISGVPFSWGMVASSSEQALNSTAYTDSEAKVVAMDEHQACIVCPHRAICDVLQSGVAWNEHVAYAKGIERPGGNTLPPRYTSVHTCKRCQRHVFDVYQLDALRPSTVGTVPEDCPRWDEIAGSGIECSLADCVPTAAA